jgi:hypothetical protein
VKDITAPKARILKKSIDETGEGRDPDSMIGKFFVEKGTVDQKNAGKRQLNGGQIQKKRK